MLRIVQGLTPRLAAPVLLTLHIGSHRSIVPEVLQGRGKVRAEWAQTGVEPVPGRIYVAPPDQHLLLEDDRLRLFRGPKEHHARPAIDPMFRSAALAGGARIVGVILSGMLDDGAAGLRAIEACGGTTVVQDPGDAEQPSMPRNALTNTEVDHVVRLDAMADLLTALAEPLHEPVPVNAPQWLRIEHAISLGTAGMSELASIGAASRLTCPDCGGSLFELGKEGPPRFRCHTGHAFSLHSLAQTQNERTEDALWVGIRELQEKSDILRRLAAEQASVEAGSENALVAEADRVDSVAQRMRALLMHVPATPDTDDPETQAAQPSPDV